MPSKGYKQSQDHIAKRYLKYIKEKESKERKDPNRLTNPIEFLRLNDCFTFDNESCY